MAEHQVKSPVPGVFYRRASPDSDNYVNEGSRVSAGSVVGLIEVMKQFFEVKAEQDGTVVAAHVADGAAVEAGQVLFTLQGA